MYQALYRSFRPETFDELFGQEHIVKILKNQIASGTTGHAYLFCGTRGTGKTSTARILAKGVNCNASNGDKPCGTCENCLAIKNGVFIDVIEIDAASNNGVDNIRELRESVKYPPVAGRCKVYIIDEVHMLSTGAFNALLKTLEEPPEHVMFILATTEPQKLPATILSRCLRLDFRRISEKRMREGFREICKSLDIKISDSALGLIVSNADGSVRDGLSLLDQCISAGGKEVARKDVLELLGTSGEEVFIEMTNLVEHHKTAEALLLLNRILSDGKDVRQFIKDWIVHYRSLLITKYIKNPEDVLNVSAENVERIREQSESTDLASISDCITELSQTLSEAKWSTQPRVLLELCIVKLAGDNSAEMQHPRSEPKALKLPKEPAAIKTVKEERRSDDTQTVKQESIDSKPADDAVKYGLNTVTVKSDAVSDEDCEKLWRRVFEEGESDRGSFYMLRKGSRLKKIDNNAFYIDVANEVAERYAKDNVMILENLMEKYTGRKLKMEYRLNTDSFSRQEQVSAEEVADELKNRLGINIEIE